jgi:hypothetical protein
MTRPVGTHMRRSPGLGLAAFMTTLTAATATTSAPKHRRDLARLLALIERPYEMREALSGKERGYLRRHRALADAGHDAWSLMVDASRGAQNLSILID